MDKSVLKETITVFLFAVVIAIAFVSIVNHFGYSASYKQENSAVAVRVAGDCKESVSSDLSTINITCASGAKFNISNADVTVVHAN